MTIIQGTEHTRLEHGFIPQPANRAPAGAFGRRVFGRTAPAPADQLEVERILARCRNRRPVAPAPRPRRSSHGNGETLAYIGTGVGILALSVISALPIL